MGKTLDAAIGKLLDNDKSPSRKTGELDNRGSQFYLAMYWAQELAAQTDDQQLAEHFASLADVLTKNEDVIVRELTEVQGEPVDIGGYYAPDSDMTTAVMRPSKTFNAALEAVKADDGLARLRRRHWRPAKGCHRTSLISHGRLRRGRKPRVAREQRDIQCGGQCDVKGVVERDVVP